MNSFAPGVDRRRQLEHLHVRPLVGRVVAVVGGAADAAEGVPGGRGGTGPTVVQLSITEKHILFILFIVVVTRFVTTTLFLKRAKVQSKYRQITDGIAPPDFC